MNVLSLDVTDDDSIRTVVDTIIRESGRIDALVNNAGYGSYGSIEDVPMVEARAQMEVNVFGLARLTQLCRRTCSPSTRHDHQHQLRGRRIHHGPRRLVPRQQVRRRGPQRRPSHGDRAARHPRRGRPARLDPHRVGCRSPRRSSKRPPVPARTRPWPTVPPRPSPRAQHRTRRIRQSPRSSARPSSRSPMPDGRARATASASRPGPWSSCAGCSDRAFDSIMRRAMGV